MFYFDLLFFDTSISPFFIFGFFKMCVCSLRMSYRTVGEKEEEASGEERGQYFFFFFGENYLKTSQYL